MSPEQRLQAFKKLYELLLFYAENRDLPVDQDFDFFKEVEFYCGELGLDFEAFKSEFKLNYFFD